MCWNNYPQVLASWRNHKCVYFEVDTGDIDYVCNKELWYTHANKKLCRYLTTWKNSTLFWHIQSIWKANWSTNQANKMVLSQHFLLCTVLWAGGGTQGFPHTRLVLFQQAVWFCALNPPQIFSNNRTAGLKPNDQTNWRACLKSYIDNFLTSGVSISEEKLCWLTWHITRRTHL